MWKFLASIGILASFAAHAEVNVLAFSGSSRDGSSNKKLIEEAANIARQQGAKVTVIDLKDYPMPFYDADWELENKLPAKAKELRTLMMQSQVILIASPEYNSSLSALLKNTLDWASRNEQGNGSREAFSGRKFVLMSASPGKGGGARGLVHLKAIIENVGGVVVPVQVSVANAYEAFDEQGHLKNPETKTELEKAIKSALN